MAYAIPQQTIIAQCTPTGPGALALLRISGIDAISIASHISKLSSGSSLCKLPSHTIHYGAILDTNGNIIDQVLFLLMRGPKTFTGEDTIEITCHNNPFIIEAIIARVIETGGRLAGNGEFTQRAVLNNKLDILQAEAIQELLHANTQAALKKSLAQLQGSFSHRVHDIENLLVHALALSEASFEFLDEEYLEFSAQIGQIVTQILATTATIQQQFNQQTQIRNGFKIAIIGSVNTGKSSLFNALVGSARAIVSPVAGTTRDSIETGLYKHGAYWTMTDTAGLRITHDMIEKEGINRSFEQAQIADLILLAIDGSRHMTGEERETYRSLSEAYAPKILTVITKADLPRVEPHEGLPISSATHEGIQELENSITSRIESLCVQGNAPFLVNKRHYNLIMELEHTLKTVPPLLSKPKVPFELVSLHIKEALSHLAQLTGKTISEQAMDTVFKSFCVGK